MAKLSRRASSSAATPTTGKTATDSGTATTTVIPSPANHATGLPQRITRRATSSNQSRPQAAALIDTSGDVLLQETAAPPPPTPAAHTNSHSHSHNNSNTATRNESSATAAPAHNTATPYMPLLPPGERNLTDAENAAERARIREEFFATYDVMTGVRIAATLGGFFGLMVFLIVWKSRSSSNETLKVLKDPKMAAVASLCMQEEEEREIQEAIVATGMSIYPDEYDAMVYRRQRMLSLGNVSAPPLLNRGYRCGSVGGVGAGVPVGYSYLLEPPRRFSYSAMSAGGGPPGPIGRRKSGSESSRIFSNYPMGGSFGTDDYFVETEDELEHEEYMEHPQDHQHLHQRTDSTRSKQGFLSVPLAGHDSRRSSAMTCCSTDSSYLERRTSAYTLGMSNLPPTLQRKLSTASRTSSIENWDYYYPDIQVIQPTPKASPCPSERSIHEASSCLSAPSIKRKHSIVSYDPDSAQAGRKQQIHSISADTVDVYPYNQAALADTVDLGLALPKPIQSAPPTSAQQAFHFCDSPSEELRLGVRRKLTLVELQRNESNNNSFPYTANAAAPVTGGGTTTATTVATSSSISVDSTPVSLDRLNGSLSLGTISVSAKLPPNAANGNPEKRAPLASLSSFKISSLECPDSELRSLEEDSVFGLESPADTDDDMQQLSSDSEEQAVAMAVIEAAAAKAAAAQGHGQSQGTSVQGSGELKANPLPQVKRLSQAQRRPLLQRHRSISAAASDRVSLIGSQTGQGLPLQQFQGPGLPVTVEAAPLETHFGAIVSHSPPRRGPLLQQYSDPQSLPTTTTTTTTTTTEDDTCSTLNTELGLLDAVVVAGNGGGESNTHTQYSSMNTVISVGRSTPSPSHASAATSPRLDNNYACSQSPSEAQAQQPAQLPHNCRLVHEPDACPSSKSDSLIATRPQSICVPSSLKDLILRKGTVAGISKSATSLSLPSNEVATTGATSTTTATATATPAVMLELPLIRLPNEDAEDEDDNMETVASTGDDKRDPSLPGTSRKWSKETLF
ncbi:serine-rich adhesin for platelets [Drosophila subobscura]|uniref:serine-rich adhesin for platelets n=1 Tax=Drosophila subobscura TaxID=7241 RepID=UPI00155A56B2|nr:serine-rich adhesin for platelets [Drosophila subobscura]